ncbi:MAG TPA: protein kinase [Aliidongia sp.]|nr:protein kinase [Aliidongia sp.]
MIGRTLGPYVIERLLGSGGAGHVYSAEDRDHDRAVAIKVLRPELSDDPDLRERFRNEAENLARLTHPNITELYSLHSETIGGQESLFMVMELIDGLTLETVLSRAGRLGQPGAMAIMAQAIAGLAHAHSLGTIHRDIKPSNLMLDESGVLKITDFGIARVEGSQRLTRQGMIVGTLSYIAPEQVKGYGGDMRSDIYSLACVFYELLAGMRPFQGNNEYELIRAQIETEPQPLSELMPDLAPHVGQAVMRALAKAPEDRFASLAEFADELGVAAYSENAAAIVREQVLPAVRREGPQSDPDGETVAAPFELPPARRAAAPAIEERAKDGTMMRRSARFAARPAIAALAAGIAVLALAGAGYAAYRSHQATTQLVAETGQSAPHEEAPPQNPGPAAKAPEPAASPAAASPAIDPPVSPAPAPPAPAPSAPPVPPVPPVQQASLPPDSSTTAPAPAQPDQPPSSIAGTVSSYADDGWPVIEGHVVRLDGVDALPGDAVKPASEWIKAHGNYLDCKLVAGDSYRCLTRQNFDLAQAILLNGGARTSADAAPAYRQAEDQARKGKRGVWR